METNRCKIVVPLFDAVNSAPNNGSTFYANFLTLISPLSQSVLSQLNFKV